MITTAILSVNPDKNSDYGATFRLSEHMKFDFYDYIGHSNDAIYNTLVACLSYLKTGAGAVAYSMDITDSEFSACRFNIMLFNQKEGLYHTSEKTDVIYLRGPLVDTQTSKINICDFCQNIIDCYYASQEEWLTFCNSENKKSAYEIHSLIKEIHDLLPQKSKYVSIVKPKNTNGFDEPDVVMAWVTGEYGEAPKVIAKIYDNDNIVYLDEAAKTDEYAQEVLSCTISYPHSCY